MTGSTPNTRLYAGEEFDPDLGLINLRARLYRPGTGRFLVRDPVERAGSNYLYAHSDSVNFIDPTGATEAEEEIAVEKYEGQATIYVYEFTETTTGRVYYGITNDLERRLGEHARRLAKQNMAILEGSFKPLYTLGGVSDKAIRPVARALEQGLILEEGGIGAPGLLNAANSMSEASLDDFQSVLEIVDLL